MKNTSISTPETTNRPTRRFRAASVGVLILLAYTMLLYDATGNIPLGSAADIISGLAVIGIAVLMFPLFRMDRRGTVNDSTGNKVLNGAYLISKLVEGALIIAGGICILSESTKDYRSLIYANFHIYFFIAGALLFYLLLYRTRLVPGVLSMWGLAASVILLLVTALRLAGIEHMILDAMLVPIAANEVVLAIWLMVKGFNK
ncbi:MAG: DUF4386 domain-containing protein [Clostridiales bacterium]|nr:DUF4386 domain-containing protein [Clostridiales bacterium]